MVDFYLMKASPIKCLISAGPTREYFDPVRYVSNPSSGKMGYALAEAATELGMDVQLVSGPVALPPPEGVSVVSVVTGQEMYEAISERFNDCDVLIMTAAIMDYKPKQVADKKIKKFQLEMVVEMEPVVDVLATVAKRKNKQLIVGFAAETDNLEDYALSKLKKKNADFIVANIIGQEGKGFESDLNEVIVYGDNNFKEHLPLQSKKEIAEKLMAIFEKKLESLSQD